MAKKNLLVHLDMNKQELQNAKAHNLTTAQRTTLAATLVAADKGLFVYDTDLLKLFVWSGVAFADVTPAPPQVGQFRGAFAHTATPPANSVNGDWVIFSSAGVLTNFAPGQTVQIGDLAFNKGLGWEIVQGNVDLATETAIGLVRLATIAEAQSFNSSNTAITPETLRLALIPFNYETAVDLVANVTKSIPVDSTKSVSQVTFYDSLGANYTPIELDWYYDSNNSDIKVTSNISLNNVVVKVVYYFN